MRDSDFFEGLQAYGQDRFRGLDVGSGREMAQQNRTDIAENVVFNNGRLVSGFGYASLGFERNLSANGRCFGLLQSTSRRYFYGYFSNAASAAQLAYYDLVALTKTELSTEVPTLLMTGAHRNGITALGNGVSLWKSVGTTVFSDLIVIPPTPTSAVSESDGTFDAVTGYQYRVTLIDTNGNETAGSAGSTTTGAFTDKLKVTATVDLGGMEAATSGFTKIRWYRTEDGGVSYIYLSGKDSTISADTAEYSIDDDLVDGTLLVGAIYLLCPNVIANTDGTTTTTENIMTTGQDFHCDFVVEFDNRLFFLAPTINSVRYGSRIYWTEEFDSSGLYPSCLTIRKDSWLSFNSGDGSDIIGGWAGLGGRLLVCKKTGSYIVTPTGNIEAPYRYDQISNDYGFYHHAISDTGSGIVGRTNAGIATFDGMAFNHIHAPVSTILERGIAPEADSCEYDQKNERLYLAICDGALNGLYGRPISTTYRIHNIWRNATLCYDMKEKSWSYHPKTLNQVYKNFMDKSGVKKIFAGGVCTEVNVLLGDSEFSGPSYSGAGVMHITTINHSFGATYCAALTGKRIAVPYCWTNGIEDEINFTEYVSEISSMNVSGGQLTVADSIPIKDNVYCVFCIDTSRGISQAGSSVTQLVDGVYNYFSAPGLAGCGWAFASYTVGYDYKTNYIQIFNNVRDAVSGLTVGDIATISSAGPGTSQTGNQYTIFPYRYFDTPAFSSDLIHFDPRRRYFLPPCGDSSEGRSKSFRYLELYGKGAAVILVRTFIDNSPTASQQFTVTLSNRDTYKRKLISLSGGVGRFMRVEINVPKGHEEFEIGAMKVFARQLGGMRGD